MQTVAKFSKQENHVSRQNPYKYKRRVHEIQNPCQWLNHCQDGKCPFFTLIDGNYYCAQENLT
ncbi:MAG: hypothetical protein ACE14S_06480 [Candidatus Bathyarchaeia archaeon]